MRRGVVCCLVMLLAGCRAGDPMRFWQQTVEEYVRDRGAGDLSAVADACALNDVVELRPALATVSARGIWANEASPTGYRDVHGALLGRVGSDLQSWYVFVVGVCEPPAADGATRSRVLDVRIAAVSGGPERFSWRTGGAESSATARYLGAESSDWPAMDVRWAFPRAADDFVLRGGDEGAEVVERRSGASWKILLTPK